MDTRKARPLLPLSLTRSTPLRSRLATFFLLAIALFLFWTFLLTPTLRLPSYIDPLTFRLRPSGDPLHLSAPANPFKPPVPEGAWWKPVDEILQAEPPRPETCTAEGPLLFLGVFSTIDRPGKRAILRTLFKPDLPGEELVEFRFIVGATSSDDWRYLAEEEQRVFGDLVFLHEEENMNQGKTVEFFEWVWRNRAAPASRRPQFVMKVDDDTFLALPNVIRALKALDCRKNVYWGTSQGSASGYSHYFRGLGYAISWPLVDWLGRLDLAPSSRVGTEDARMGYFLHWLSNTQKSLFAPSETPGNDSFEFSHPRSPVERVDTGWGMGDWDQITVTTETIAAHWLKLDHWMPMIRRKFLGAWKAAGREYRWDWDQLPSTALSTLDDAQEERTGRREMEERIEVRETREGDEEEEEILERRRPLRDRARVAL